MKQKSVVSRSVQIVIVVILMVLLAACGAPAAVEPAAVGVVDSAEVEAASDLPVRAATGAQRVSFAAGVSEVTVEGSFDGQDQAQIVFWAEAGKVLSVSVSSSQGSTMFHLEGADYKQVVKHLLDGENSWTGSLSMSQDYVLTIDNADLPAEYTVQLATSGG